MKKSADILMTEGPIGRQIIAFAFPVFLGNLFQQLYSVVDSLVVGNFTGKEALAAVSSSGSLTMLIVGLIAGIFMGAGVVISRYYGAQDGENVSAAVHTTVAFALIAGVLLTISGVILTPFVLKLMGTPASVLPDSILYFRIYFAGVIFSALYNSASGVMQAVGDSRHPLYYLMVSSVTNVLLDLLFVAVFHWGVAGAAVATTISQAASAFLGLRHLCRVAGPQHLVPAKIRINTVMLKEILHMGIPSGVQNSIIAFANLVVQSKINAFGDVAMAGCGAYSKIEGFVFIPVMSFALALTTFIGQNLGAKEYGRAKRGARFGIIVCMILAELVGLFIYFFAPTLIGLFNREQDIVAFGAMQAHIVTLFYCLLALSHCIAGIMRGAGRAVVPMLTMLTCWCVIRVSYITIAVRLLPDIRVIFWAYPLTWLCSSLFLLIYFLRVDWLHAYEKSL